MKISLKYVHFFYQHGACWATQTPACVLHSRHFTLYEEILFPSLAQLSIKLSSEILEEKVLSLNEGECTIMLSKRKAYQR